MDKDLDYMKRLIDQYMNGETSIEEQGILAEFFRSSHIPEELKYYKTMFDVLSEPITEPSDEELDAFALANNIKIRGRAKLAPMFFKIVSVAAIAVFVFLIGYCFGKRSDSIPVITQVPAIRERIVKQICIVKDTVMIERPVIVKKMIIKQVADNSQTHHRIKKEFRNDCDFAKSTADTGLRCVTMAATSPDNVEKYFKKALDAHDEIEKKEVKNDFKSYGYAVSF
jgi:hypothetical protein